jgi:hypothetical protein
MEILVVALSCKAFTAMVTFERFHLEVTANMAVEMLPSLESVSTVFTSEYELLRRS